MIISHKYRLIYIRLQKVAGASFEVALFKYCDQSTDILGGYKRKVMQDTFPNLKNTSGVTYGLHTPATLIKRKVAPDIWNNYTKIATLRNPYERMISKYYFRRNYLLLRKQKMAEFGEYVSSFKSIAAFLYDAIHIEGKSVLDYYIRYENLAEDILTLEEKINCPGLYETMRSVSAHKQQRPKEGASSGEMYTKYPEAKLAIDKDLYANWDKYELLRAHWPAYKSELENILAV